MNAEYLYSEEDGWQDKNSPRIEKTRHLIGKIGAGIGAIGLAAALYCANRAGFFGTNPSSEEIENMNYEGLVYTDLKYQNTNRQGLLGKLDRMNDWKVCGRAERVMRMKLAGLKNKENKPLFNDEQVDSLVNRFPHPNTYNFAKEASEFNLKGDEIINACYLLESPIEIIWNPNKNGTINLTVYCFPSRICWKGDVKDEIQTKQFSDLFNKYAQKGWKSWNWQDDR